MKSFEQLERLKRMNRLIKEERTGSPQEFAKRLGVSKSHLYRCIEEVRELGAPIRFCRTRQTYFYKNEFELKVSYSVQLISEQMTKKIAGGYHLKNTSLLFYESGQI